MENSNGSDKNVGNISIEEAIKIMEHWIEYEKANKDKIDKADELILIQETILSDYKRLKEEFYNIDHECSRLEDIDIKKDLKIIKLQEKNKKQEELIERMKRFLFKENKMCDFLESEDKMQEEYDNILNILKEE